MTITGPALTTLTDYLSEPLQIGAPDTMGPLAVFPLFGAPPELEYTSFAQGSAEGVAITELESGASVNDLVVSNPTGLPVLLYEGEEVLGAQQNRTFDVSVVVPAGGKLKVPVSCVEHGRWDASRHAEPFAPAPHAAYPELRRRKAEQVRTSVALGMEARAQQGAVWNEVAEKSERMGVSSRTAAMHDIYSQRRDGLAELQTAMKRHDRQLGALAAIGGRFCVLDFVSRSDVFAALHAPLVQGYALDALESRDAPAPSVEAAQAAVESLVHAHLSERTGLGLGRDVRFDANPVAGAGLVLASELVQVSAFFGGDDGDVQPATPYSRIRRPSRRR